MGAMPEEIEGITRLMQHKTKTTSGGRTYYCGQINGTKVVLVFSRWGKVAAATTTTNLILQFKITHLLFTGVAGGIANQIQVGDIVVATSLIQHDMDARPLMPQYEIPLLGKTYFDTDETLSNQLITAAGTFLNDKELHRHIDDATLKQFGITQPKLHTGVIASGDKFVSDNSYRDSLLQNLPGVVCVEMEGAAVAQVCYEYNIPFCIIRTISDSADEHAHFSFTDFIKQVAGVYSFCIIQRLLH